MKKYFAKYLPVEGNINGGEYYKSKKYPHLEAKVATANWSKQILDFYDVQKAKLFLCSRDIQAGDEVYIETEVVSQQYQSPINGKGIIQKINNKHEILIYRNNGELLPFDCNELTKVIGEISPDATWVKEGDEFDKDEVQILGENQFGELHDLGLYKKSDYVNVVCLIKGPCGHFH